MPVTAEPLIGTMEKHGDLYGKLDEPRIGTMEKHGIYIGIYMGIYMENSIVPLRHWEGDM